MNNYKSPGNVLTLTAPGGGVTAGVPVQIGQIIAIPATTAAATESFEGLVEGVVEITKDAGAGTAWAEGVPIYWDSGNAEATIVASGNLPIGRAAAAAADGDTLGEVKLSAGGGMPTVFQSAEQTGTGSPQNVAHGLGVAPSLVIVTLTEFADTLAVDVAEGTHTATNVVLTVASGAKFKVYAFA